MSDQGSVYASFVEAELRAERDRRAALEARGQTLVTTCGALVTLMAGLAGFAKAVGGGFVLSPDAVVALVVALAGLAAAAACGIAAGWNYLYAVPHQSTLEQMIGDRWGDNEIDARNIVATVRIMTLDSLRVGTSRKAIWVSIGQLSLVASLAALAVVILLPLRGH